MKAFTLFETLLVLFIMSIITFLSIDSKSYVALTSIKSEIKAKNLAGQLTYYKSLAISKNESIAVFFITGHHEVKIIEKGHKVTLINLPNGRIVNSRNMSYIIIKQNGDLDRFGTIDIEFDKQIYHFIFHIEKGSLRIEKA